MKIQVNWKRALILISVLLFLLTLWIVFIVDAKAESSYGNCDDILHATGRRNIPKGDKLYNKALDRDADNIACEG